MVAEISAELLLFLSQVWIVKKDHWNSQLPIVGVNATVDHEVIGPPAAVKNIEFPIPILRGWKLESYTSWSGRFSLPITI